MYLCNRIHSAIKKNKILKFAGKWLESETISVRYWTRNINTANTEDLPKSLLENYLKQYTCERISMELAHSWGDNVPADTLFHQVKTPATEIGYILLSDWPRSPTNQTPNTTGYCKATGCSLQPYGKALLLKTPFMPSTLLILSWCTTKSSTLTK